MRGTAGYRFSAKKLFEDNPNSGLPLHREAHQIGTIDKDCNVDERVKHGDVPTKEPSNGSGDNQLLHHKITPIITVLLCASCASVGMLTTCTAIVMPRANSLESPDLFEKSSIEKFGWGFQGRLGVNVWLHGVNKVTA
jgi:hypothetical protein